MLSPPRATWVGAKVLSRIKSAVSTRAIHVAFRSELNLLYWITSTLTGSGVAQHAVAPAAVAWRDGALPGCRYWHSIPVWVRRRRRPIQFERKCDACDNKTNSSILRGDYGVRADRCRVQPRDQIR